MNHRITAGCATFAVVVSLVSSAIAQPDAQFVRANDEFAKGQFQHAIRDYEALVQARDWSAPLFYNLGNAYFRVADFGRAILSYERALALEPQHPETVANLALAREEARALELQNNRFTALLKHVSSSQLTIAAVIAFWIAVFAIAAILLNRRRSAFLVAIALLGSAVAIGGGVCINQIEKSRKSLAIVVAPEVQARLATADNASSVLQLPPGSEINVLSRRGDWVYAQLPNNLRGWIPSPSIELVRL